jgi:hypothetical protein
MSDRRSSISSVTLNLVQGPSCLRAQRIKEEWMLKQVQHDGEGGKAE